MTSAISTLTRIESSSQQKTVPSEAEIAKARKIARDFETIMAQSLIKSMRAGTGKNTLISGGKGEEMFGSMLDQEYAAVMAQKNTLGIAKDMEEKILRNSGYKSYKYHESAAGKGVGK